jgi:hypothetical protein
MPAEQVQSFGSSAALDRPGQPAEVDSRLSGKLPFQLHVFIDPTQTRQTPQPRV